MNIIDEMRREAGNAERSGHTYESLFMTEWADRLAASGALVPVQDGPNMPVSDCGTDKFFVLCGGSLAVLGYDSEGYREAQTVNSFIGYRADVLPVRLVPITEAEV